MKTVYLVEVYDSHSQTTEVWRVFDCKTKAKEFKEDIESDTNLNNAEEDWYVVAKILEYTVD